MSGFNPTGMMMNGMNGQVPTYCIGSPNRCQTASVNQQLCLENGRPAICHNTTAPAANGNGNSGNGTGDTADKGDKSGNGDKGDKATGNGNADKITLSGKPLWKRLCTGDALKRTPGDDVDHDTIPAACETALFDKGYIALDPNEFNGYRIGAVRLQAPTVVKKNPLIASWDAVKGFFTDSTDKPSPLNEKIADVILSLKQKNPEASSLNIIQQLFAAADPVYIGGKDAQKNQTNIKGGIDEPIIIKPTAAGFNLCQLTGIGCNTANLSTRDKFIYVAEAFVHVPDRDLPIHIARLSSSGARQEATGAFMVFVDGLIELSTIDLSHLRGDEREGIKDIDKKLDGSIKGGDWRHLVVALIGQEEPDPAVARQLIHENVFIQMDPDANVWEPLPQEIALPKMPKDATLATETGDQLILLKSQKPGGGAPGAGGPHNAGSPPPPPAGQPQGK